MGACPGLAFPSDYKNVSEMDPYLGLFLPQSCKAACIFPGLPVTPGREMGPWGPCQPGVEGRVSIPLLDTEGKAWGRGSLLRGLWEKMGNKRVWCLPPRSPLNNKALGCLLPEVRD